MAKKVKVKVGTHVYGSMTHCAEALGISCGTVNNRIKAGDYKVVKDEVAEDQQVKIDGFIYSSVKAASKATGLKESVIKARIKERVYQACSCDMDAVIRTMFPPRNDEAWAGMEGEV